MSDTNLTQSTINMSGLAAKLTEAFDGLFDGSRDAKDCVELNNTAGKIISAHMTIIAYHALRSERPNIPFLSNEVDGPASIGSARLAAVAVE
jgi:hypothetical protein